MSSEKISILNINESMKKLHANQEFLISSIYASERMQYQSNYKTIYAFIAKGSANLITDSFNCQIGSSTYFAVSKKYQLEFMENASGIIIETNFNDVLNTIGGPIENQGRLKYIDGCSDTLLISPAKQGEPCLNLLHFPANTTQTMHHHPSFRFGIVVSGNGESVSETGKIPLKAGDVFFIPENFEHKFNTFENEMNVIAFHPDSDWGPTDEIHPMKNRTWFKNS